MRVRVPWSSYAEPPYATFVAVLLCALVLKLAPIPEDSVLRIFGFRTPFALFITILTGLVWLGWLAASLTRHCQEVSRAKKLLATGVLPCKRCGHPTVTDGAVSLCCECGRKTPTERLRKHWERKGVPVGQKTTP